MIQRIKDAAEVVFFGGFDIVTNHIPELWAERPYLSDNIVEAWEYTAARATALGIGVVALSEAVFSAAPRRDRPSDDQ